MAEPWIRVHADLGSKPVTQRAADALGVKRAAAAGHLVFFWGNVSRHATNGVIAHYPDALLELWACWEGTRGRFAKFIRDNHLDDDGRVREWDEYAGALEQRKQKNREHQAAWRARHKDDVSLTSDLAKGVTRRDETKRDETEDQQQEQPRASRALPEWVGLAVAQYAEKVGPIPPGRMRKALSSLVTKHGWESVAKGLADYLSATPLAKARPEWFAERGTYWVELAKQPMIDPETCEPTERQRVIVGRTGRAA